MGRRDLALSGWYRRTGAEPLFGDARRAHGVGFEGYYWRFAGPGWSVAAICGVCRDARGTWAMVTLAGAEAGGGAVAASPVATERTAVAQSAWVDGGALGVRAGELLRADADGLEVALGPDAWLRAAFTRRRGWPRRAWGALGPAQLVPRLGQYWTPHLLGAQLRGTFALGGRERALDGALVYAEKNWGEAFAPHWWWGHVPLGQDAGVAFAGGRLARAGVPVAPTAVVAWTPAGLVRLAPPLARTVASAGGGSWRVRASTPRTRIELEGEALAPPLRLAVPVPAERRLEVHSSHHLLARATVTVRRGRRVWLREETTLAALEDGA